jgi:hypothetical protein
VAEERISRAHMSRRRTANGTYVMRPGEFFPLPVDRPFASVGTLEFYAKVDLDLAVKDRDRYRRWAEAFTRIMNALEPKEREPWMRAWANDFYGSRPVLMFYLLGYDVDAHYVVDPRRAMSYPAYRASVMGSKQAAMYFVFTPHTDAFAESVNEKLIELEDNEAFYDMVVWPIVRAQMIILREVAFLVVGGQVIRLGGWLLVWANDLRIVGVIVRRVVMLGNQYKTAKAAIALTDDLFKVFKVIGHRLLQILDVVGTHDLLLELVPELVKLERRIAERLSILIGIQESGAVPIDGWTIEDDPVERAFHTAMLKRMADLAT